MVADQHHGHFTGLLIHLRDQPQLIRPARQTFHVELAERAFRRRPQWLIILSSLEKRVAVNFINGILHRASDNGCPSTVAGRKSGSRFWIKDDGQARIFCAKFCR
jgi:hypothetical protein